ncbi:MAG TPA: hypothetical protein VIL85_13100, partial [Thermomicrobiales bacterium]
MRFLLRPWRVLYRAYARRLSWKLTLSHLTVAVICQIVYLAGAVLIILVNGQANQGGDPLPFSSREMSEETRILATALAPAVASGSTAELGATLRRLPPPEATGLGAFDGVLSPTNALVVVAPDGTILAASEPTLAALGTVTALDPPVWGAVLNAALGNGSAPDAALPALTGRDSRQRRLMTAYPIVDGQGRIIGALGLRSAVAAPPGATPSFWQVLAS